MSKKFATIISRIFDPFVVTSIAFIFIFLHGGESLFVFGISFFLIIGIPVILMLIALRKKIVGNWDISERHERPKAFGVLIALEFLNFFLLRPIVSAQTLHTFLFILIVFIGFSIITLFWKISGHAMANALASGIIISLLGIHWWPILLIVPLVGWARVARRDHTPAQVIAGAIYSWIVLVLFR